MLQSFVDLLLLKSLLLPIDYLHVIQNTAIEIVQTLYLISSIWKKGIPNVFFGLKFKNLIEEYHLIHQRQMTP